MLFAWSFGFGQVLACGPSVDDWSLKNLTHNIAESTCVFDSLLIQAFSVYGIAFKPYRLQFLRRAASYVNKAWRVLFETDNVR